MSVRLFNIYGVTNSGSLEITVPDAPIIQSFISGNEELVVEFSLGNNGGSPVIDIEYELNDEGWVSAGQIISPFKITGLVNGVEYLVRIRAVNNIGPSSSSNSVFAIPSTIPGKPIIDSLSEGNEKLGVNFFLGGDGGAPLIGVEYQLDDENWVNFNDVTSPQTISNLTNGVTYQVRIKALNINGESEPSNIVEGTPIDSEIKIFVDDFINDFNDPTDVRNGILEAHTEAVSQGAVLLFSGRNYIISNNIVVTNSNWKGVAGVTNLIKDHTYFPNAGYRFNGSAMLEGIIFDVSQNNLHCVYFSGSNGTFSMTDCEVIGARQAQTGTGSTRALRCDVRNMFLSNVKCHGHDSLAERNNNNHQTPQVRGIHIEGGASDRYIEIDNCEIYNTRSLISQNNWGEGSGIDIDGIIIDQPASDPLGNRTTYITNCKFWDNEKRHIKANRGDIVYCIGNTFITKQGKATRDPLDYQESTNGAIIGNEFIFERGQDGPHGGQVLTVGSSTSASDGATDDFEIKDNKVIVENSSDLLSGGNNTVNIIRLGGLGPHNNMSIADNFTEFNGGSFRHFISFNTPGVSQSSGTADQFGWHDLNIAGNDFSNGTMEGNRQLVTISGSQTTGTPIGNENYYEIISENNNYGSNPNNDSTFPSNWNNYPVASGSSYNGQIKTLL